MYNKLEVNGKPVGECLCMKTHRHTRTHVCTVTHTHTYTHTRLMALFSGTTQASQYQKSKTNLDFTEARHSEWQWHHLSHIMQVCNSLHADNNASTPPLSFLQAGCPSCHPTSSVKALKALHTHSHTLINRQHIYRRHKNTDCNVKAYGSKSGCKTVFFSNNNYNSIAYNVKL